MQKGKLFEIIVNLIEETIKEKDFVKVVHDTYLIDKDSIKRQIDVLIEVDYGERLGKQRIIIECKNRRSKIEVKEIGSLIDLVKSTNSIYGIIVSKVGFQSGSIKKAMGSNGMIKLYTLENIDKEEVSTWFDKPMYSFKYKVDIDKIRYKIRSDQPILNTESRQLIESNYYRYDKLICNSFNDFILHNLINHIPILKNEIAELALNLHKTDQTEEEGIVSLGLNLSGGDKILYNDTFYQIEDFAIELPTKLIREKNTKISYSEYKDINEEKSYAEVTNSEFSTHFLTIVNDTRYKKKRMFITTKKKPPQIIEIYDLGALDEYLKNKK